MKTILALVGGVTLLLLGLGALFGTSATPATSSASGPLLELLASRDTVSSSYHVLEGEVRNASGQSLKNVTAVASYYDAAGTFITSGDALIDFDPLLAGQTSPFKVMTRQNPAIKSYTVTFKQLLGGTLPHRDLEGSRR